MGSAALFMTSSFVLVISSILKLLLDVGKFWKNKLWRKFKQKPLRKVLKEQMEEAMTYEQWYHAASQLDAEEGNDIWRSNPTSPYYNSPHLLTHLTSLLQAASSPSSSAVHLSSLLRPTLLRNTHNILSPSLYTTSHIGTKHLISTYTTTVSHLILKILSLPSFTPQQKFSFISDTRQSFGRTTLVLQGGAIFGLFHLGVVKALHQANLLPRIITGTGVGALIASLVCIHTDAELPEFLTADGIDLTAFASHPPARSISRKLHRFWNTGYLLDIAVLEECVTANVGDLTFLEAYQRTGRILNITVATPPNSSLPSSVLNYLTSPHVLIRTAACASCASPPLFSSIPLLAKSPIHGTISEFNLFDSTGGAADPNPNSSVGEKWTWHPWWTASSLDPHTRISELFNVNNFIVSQARPYIAPFLHSSPHLLTRLVGLEITHLLRQADTLGLLPAQVRRFLVDESIGNSGPGECSRIVIVPKVGVADWVLLGRNPERGLVEEWVKKGERAVWAVGERVRVSLEVEMVLDREYTRMRKKEVDEGDGVGVKRLLGPPVARLKGLKRRVSMG